MRLNRRRVRTRRFTRPAKPESTGPIPLDVDLDGSPSTEFAVEAVKAQSAPKSSQQDSTVELKAIPSQADPNEETAEVLSTAQPEPPRRMEFACPCGTTLVATHDHYDKHTRCGMCQTVLLVNLVYDAETRTHEIVAFRVNPEPPQ